MNEIRLGEELEGMRRFHIAHRGHFALGLVRSNEGRAREKAIDGIRELLEQARFPVFVIQEAARIGEIGLYGFLAELNLNGIEGLLLTGIDALVLGSSGQAIVRQLNVERDAIRRILGRPFTIWLSDAAMDRVVEEAPDFTDWHGAVFRIPEALAAAPPSHSAVDREDGLSHEVLAERVEILREQLSFLKDRPNAAREAAIYSELSGLLGRYPEGLGRLAEALEAARLAIERMGPVESRTSAIAFLHLARALNDSGNVAEAETAISTSVRIFDATVPERMDAVTSVQFTAALRERASILRQLDRREQALAAVERAIGVIRGTVGLPSDELAQRQLAAALIEKGLAQFWLHAPAAARDSFSEAIRIFRDQQAAGGSTIAAFHLARALTSRGRALRAAGDLRDSHADFDEAVTIFSGLLAKSERGNLRARTAWAMAERGQLLEATGRVSDAIREYDNALDLIHAGTVSTAGWLTAGDAGGILALKAAGQWRSGLLDQSLLNFDRVISIYVELVYEQQCPQFSENLLSALVQKAQALVAVGRRDEARPLLDRAVEEARSSTGFGHRAMLTAALRAREDLAGGGEVPAPDGSSEV